MGQDRAFFGLYLHAAACGKTTAVVRSAILLKAAVLSPSIPFPLALAPAPSSKSFLSDLLSALKQDATAVITSSNLTCTVARQTRKADFQWSSCFACDGEANAPLALRFRSNCGCAVISVKLCLSPQVEHSIPTACNHRLQRRKGLEN